jgi:hypothetical protein
MLCRTCGVPNGDKLPKPKNWLHMQELGTINAMVRVLMRDRYDLICVAGRRFT